MSFTKSPQSFLFVFVMCCGLLVGCFDVVCMQFDVSVNRFRSDSIAVSRDIQSFLALDLAYSRPSPWKEPKNNKVLYTFAFNVGQANFVVVRKGKEIVIVDAGTVWGVAAEYLLEPIQSVFQDASVKGVFITHPHSDHFNLFLDGPLCLRDMVDFSGAEFYLGGNSVDWKRTQETKEFVSKIPPSRCHYYDCGKIYNELISDVSFRVFYLPKSSLGVNKLSLLIQASYSGKNILFTGDSEGDSIDRLIGGVYNLQQVADMFRLKISLDTDEEKFVENIDRLYDCLNMKAHHKINSAEMWSDVDVVSCEIDTDHGPVDVFTEYWRLYSQAAEKGLIPDENEIISSYQSKNPSLYGVEDISLKKVLLAECLNFMLQRRIFENSHVIFVPHHGARSECSQRFLGFFSGIDSDKIYVVNSSPFGVHGLPKRSTLEMAPFFPAHPSHPFIYYEDFTDMGDNAALQMTTKPIYVTGAAPGWYYFFSIVPTDHTSLSSVIYMFDPYRRGNGKVIGGWFDALTGKYNDAVDD